MNKEEENRLRRIFTDFIIIEDHFKEVEKKLIPYYTIIMTGILYLITFT